MNHYDAWMIVFLDILNSVKYIAPPFFWMIVGANIFNESFDGGVFITIIIAIALTYWSYQ